MLYIHWNNIANLFIYLRILIASIHSPQTDYTITATQFIFRKFKINIMICSLLSFKTKQKITQFQKGEANNQPPSNQNAKSSQSTFRAELAITFLINTFCNKCVDQKYSRKFCVTKLDCKPKAYLKSCKRSAAQHSTIPQTAPPTRTQKVCKAHFVQKK